MKNIFKQIAFIALVFVTFNSNAQVTGCYVPSYAQSQTQWCWATCGQMLYWSYQPGSVSQCTFVQKSVDQEQVFWGIFGCNNMSHSSTSVCSSPSTFNQPQSLYGCDGSLANVLDQYDIHSTSYSSNISGANLSSYLSSKKLVVARWGWNSGGGHALLVYRYKNGYVYFNNPGDGSAYTWTWNTFNTANGSGSWTHSLRMNSSAVYGTTYYRGTTDIKSTNVEEELSINAYPNPATDKVNIIVNGLRDQDIHLLVTDAVGRVIFSQDYSKGIPSIALDVTNWNRGLYFLNVNGEKKLAHTISLR